MLNLKEMRRVQRIHMVGIGGSGMCGLARILHELGYKISGSDIVDNATLDDLRQLGVVVYVGHNAVQVKNSDVLVTSSAITADNVECQQAHNSLIPVIPRAEMLAELMRFRHGIAISGTHGKTTTTSMIVSVMTAAKLSPTSIIGGRINQDNFGAALGASDYLIAEADESDASFLHLQPMTIVLTNLEADHLENYQGDFRLLRQAYINFLHNLPFYGLALLCLDDPVLAELINEVPRPMRSYGFSQNADYRIVNYKSTGLGSNFEIGRSNAPNLPISLSVPGKHNASNAVAAAALALEYDVGDDAIINGLQSFERVERRFQVHDNVLIGDKKVCLIDDYGHHPTELRVTMACARDAFPTRRLLMIFQPHRYSRLRDLYDSFVDVLSASDCLILLAIYGAGEEAIVDINSQALCRSVRQRKQVDPVYAKDIDEAVLLCSNLVRDDDVVLLQGAGTISLLKSQLLSEASSKVVPIISQPNN